ncbi:SDR family oxidoreductase [Salmonella enterica subsp. enterica serovar Portland]|uniref:SDR family oxidoreductase n=1 Tax=Salmonella enterica TaxID=28901 RepID=UPI000FBA17C3|nr:SDR family oxidoreductase [Salmonella enterica]EBF8127897.1 SDR family oxidoreductase [Salmonella enterica subsp. enterica]EBG5100113.1 SDR family oxidoreductase [Salmonella enterica subsp. enterica serovar India]EBU7941072.1 SDR family NAD(P)-dependent oxidoreductase [Salmonella enterica subsp. enterica serovar Chittagong]EBX6014103.1 SDR family NAD(P)-dependent oxidoreductase [Salmonella enterica subsp. enterica serovar Dortmund]EBY5130609.1 SDR family oxidoreductase [Salmonella enterica 
MTKIALVTGGSKGIGFAAAKALYDIGYTVVAAARNEETLQHCAQGLSPERFVPMVADVASEAAVQVLFAAIKERFGRLDLLFNNAGNNSPAKTIEEISFEEWSRVFSVNVHSTFLCAKEAIKIMKSQSPMGGRIINNASISAMTPRLYTAPYTASKHAVTGLTKAISLDCRQFNIACGQINIGNAETTLSSRMKKGVYQADGSIKTEDMMNVDDVAAAIKMMAQLPVTTNVLEITIMANSMPYVGRG